MLQKPLDEPTRHDEDKEKVTQGVASFLCEVGELPRKPHGVNHTIECAIIRS